MLNILTGLPLNKNNDNLICTGFANSIGHKILLGSSTMKMYCRELNLPHTIKTITTAKLPTVKYLIEGITIASEGIITLNECYKILSDKPSDNINAIETVNLLKQENKINFIIGTANNGQHSFYKQNNLLPRAEIIEKIINLLTNKEISKKFI